jgi:hypothetical protein
MTVATWFLLMAWIMREPVPVTANCYGTEFALQQAIKDQPAVVWELLVGCPFERWDEEHPEVNFVP